MFFLVLPIFYFFLGPLIKVVPEKRFTLPAESTLTRIYIRKTLSPLPVPKADNSSNSKAKEATQTGKAILYFPVKSPWYFEEWLKQHIFSKRTDGKLLLLEISKSRNCSSALPCRNKQYSFHLTGN